MQFHSRCSLFFICRLLSFPASTWISLFILRSWKEAFSSIDSTEKTSRQDKVYVGRNWMLIQERKRWTASKLQWENLTEEEAVYKFSRCHPCFGTAGISSMISSLEPGVNRGPLRKRKRSILQEYTPDRMIFVPSSSSPFSVIFIPSSVLLFCVKTQTAFNHKTLCCLAWHFSSTAAVTL